MNLFLIKYHSQLALLLIRSTQKMYRIIGKTKYLLTDLTYKKIKVQHYTDKLYLKN